MIYPMVPFPVALSDINLDINFMGLLLMLWRAICLR